MTLRKALQYTINELSQNVNVDIEAQTILEYVTGLTQLELFTNPDKTLTPEEIEKLKFIIKERKTGKPLAYIIGKQEFLGLEFDVNENTLIPRLDTEFVVSEALDEIDQYPEKNVKVLDLCCGSGVIGLSLKERRPEISLTMADISDGALDIAKLNSKKLNLEADIIKSDLFKSIKGKFNIIISNPPYIPPEEYKELSEDILNYEPKLALLAEEGGYYYHSRIIAGAKKFLEKNGTLLLECGYNQGKNLKGILEASGFNEIEILDDFAGFNRVAKAKIL